VLGRQVEAEFKFTDSRSMMSSDSNRTVRRKEAGLGSPGVVELRRSSWGLMESFTGVKSHAHVYPGRGVKSEWEPVQRRGVSPCQTLSTSGWGVRVLT
jgi:hypothetical protein